MDTPVVSVIMNCYNGAKYLEEALVSLINQNFKNWEIIFWDNASTDNSPELFNKFKDERFHYFKSETNITLFAARNLALQKTSGKYICFLDTDDAWVENKLRKQVDFMDANPDLILSFTDAFYIFNKEKSSDLFSSDFKFYHGHVFKELFTNYFINMPSVMINSNICESELYFKNNYQYAGDSELFLRLSLKGRIDYIPEPLVYYRVHSSNVSRNIDVVLKDREILIESFREKCFEYNININKVYNSLYKSMAKRYVLQKKFNKAMELCDKLIKYPDLVSYVFFFIFKLRLTFVLYFIGKIKTKLSFQSIKRFSS